MLAFTIKRRLNQMIGQLSHHASPLIVFRLEYWSNIEHNNDIYKCHLKCHSLDSASLGIDLLHNLVGTSLSKHPSVTIFKDHLGMTMTMIKTKCFKQGWNASHIPGFKNPTYAIFVKAGGWRLLNMTFPYRPPMPLTSPMSPVVLGSSWHFIK